MAGSDATAGDGWPGRAIALVAALTAWRLLYVALSPIDLDFEEAQYWFWAQDPAWGYFSKPPLIAWLIAASTAIAGDGEFGVRFLSPLLHGATAIAVGAVAARLGGPRAGLWTALAYATLPGASFSAGLMTTDVPLLFAWSVALYAFVRLGQGGGLGWAILGGLATGIGLLAKYAMLFFAPAALLALLLMADWRRRIGISRLAIMGGLAALLIAPNLVWNFTHGGATLHHTAALAVGGRRANAETIFAFLGGQVAIAGALVVAMAVAGLAGVAAMRRPADAASRPLMLLACFAVPIFVAFVAMAMITRVNANWTGPIYVAATAATIMWGLARGWHRWIRLGVAANAAIAVIAPLVIVNAVYFAAAAPLPIVARSLDRVTGWQETGAALDALRAELEPATLLFADTTLAKRMIYYSDLSRGDFAMWNEGRVPRSELDRVASLMPDADGRWLLVSSHPFDATGSARHFAGSGPVQELVVPLPSGESRRLFVQALAGFDGYRP